MRFKMKYSMMKLVFLLFLLQNMICSIANVTALNSTEIMCRSFHYAHKLSGVSYWANNKSIVAVANVYGKILVIDREHFNLTREWIVGGVVTDSSVGRGYVDFEGLGIMGDKVYVAHEQRNATIVEIDLNSKNATELNFRILWLPDIKNVQYDGPQAIDIFKYNNSNNKMIYVGNSLDGRIYYASMDSNGDVAYEGRDDLDIINTELQGFTVMEDSLYVLTSINNQHSRMTVFEIDDTTGKLKDVDDFWEYTFPQPPKVNTSGSINDMVPEGIEFVKPNVANADWYWAYVAFDYDDGGFVKEYKFKKGVGFVACNYTTESEGNDNDNDDDDNDDQSNIWTFMTDNWIYFIIPLVIIVIVFLVVFVAFLVVLLSLMSKQKKKLKKFGNVDVNVLLEEQEAEKKTTANVSIDSTMFNIKDTEIELVKVIWKGGSGNSIFFAKWNETEVACKVFKIDAISGGKNVKEFEKETQIMASISHPNILNFYGLYIKKPNVGIVMEFCENGDMKSFFEKSPEKFDKNTKHSLFKGVCEGLKYLHDRKIIHRDLKLMNILVSKTLEAKVSDFGLSKVVELGTQKTTRVGTSLYMSPQMTMGEEYSEKTDVFSFSMMLYIIYYENLFPYGVNPDFCVELKVANNADFRPKLDDEKESWVNDMIKKCWNHDESLRPSFGDLVAIFNDNGPKTQNVEEGKKADDATAPPEEPKEEAY